MLCSQCTQTPFYTRVGIFCGIRFQHLASPQILLYDHAGYSNRLMGSNLATPGASDWNASATGSRPFRFSLMQPFVTKNIPIRGNTGPTFSEWVLLDKNLLGIVKMRKRRG